MRNLLTIVIAAGTTLALMACRKPLAEAQASTGAPAPQPDTTEKPSLGGDESYAPAGASATPPIATSSRAAKPAARSGSASRSAEVVRPAAGEGASFADSASADLSPSRLP